MIEALLASDDFHCWVAGTATAAEAARWEAWAAQSPQHAQAVSEARVLLEGLAFRPPALPDIDAEWQQLRARIHATRSRRGARVLRRHTRPTHPSRPGEQHRAWRGWAAAGALTIVLIVVASLFVHPGERNGGLAIAAAGPHDQQVLNLSDGTRIVVGAQSALRYPAEWPEDGPREVWLEGEALFEVQPRPDRARPEFYVHTPDGTVEVLGTTFTVRRRYDRTMVVLNEGAVSVRVEGAADSARATATLQPGDLAEFRHRADSVSLRRVNPDVYSSWTTDVLLFDETPISEIVERIEATYDLEVALPDSALLQRTLSGSIPNHQLDLLMRALRHTLGRAVYRQGNVIRIAPAPAPR